MQTFISSKLVNLMLNRQFAGGPHSPKGRKPTKAEHERLRAEAEYLSAREATARAARRGTWGYA